MAILTIHDIYEAQMTAMKAVLPEILDLTIEIKSKLEELSDFPTQKQGAEAIGVSPAKITQWIKSGDLTTVSLKGMSRPRLQKEQVKSLLIKSRISNLKMSRI
jgi:DNA replication protein DnaD